MNNHISRLLILLCGALGAPFIIGSDPLKNLAIALREITRSPKLPPPEQNPFYAFFQDPFFTPFGQNPQNWFQQSFFQQFFGFQQPYQSSFKTQKAKKHSPKPEPFFGFQQQFFEQPPQSPQQTQEQKQVYLEKKIHELINGERKKQGLKALEWNNLLGKAARNHSDDMVKRNFFSHYSPEGNSFTHRYKQVGFNEMVPTGPNTYALGAENIAYRTSAYSQYHQIPLDTTAKEIVLQWMNSEGHKKNILTPYWIRQGIGITFKTEPNGSETVYATENFC